MSCLKRDYDISKILFHKMFAAGSSDLSFINQYPEDKKKNPFVKLSCEAPFEDSYHHVKVLNLNLQNYA